MRRIIGWRALLLCVVLAPLPASADLYQAAAAVEKQDLARAFELYRELAEMGQPVAQENLAVMYVNGEGVKRDNVLGYAWAVMAVENGSGDVAKGIVEQLTPYLNDAARARVAELQAKFGKEALEKTLLPLRRNPADHPELPECRIVQVANPDHYYPNDARQRGVMGDTLVELLIFGDGHAHDPRSSHSYPPDVFSAAGRNVSLHNRATPKLVNGVAVPCSIKIKVKFSIRTADWFTTKDELIDQIAPIREKANRGDPIAQLAYAIVIENRSDLAGKDDLPLWWYLKAAQAGIPAAQQIVGVQLLPAEEAKGLFWLNKAAAAGNPEAQLGLANYYMRKLPDSAALAAAVDWFRKAVEGGSRDARFYFAALLATGPDAALRDPTRALDLIEQAKSDYGTNPIWFEIRAAAWAMSGDFVKAQKEQDAAVRAAKKLGWNTAPQQGRLADYIAKKSWSGDLFAFY